MHTLPLRLQSEGVELMWIMLQSKKQSRYGAVKLLDFCTTRYALPCEKLVDLGGLKHLFGIFMGKARIKGPKGERGGMRRWRRSHAGAERGEARRAAEGASPPRALLRRAVPPCRQAEGLVPSSLFFCVALAGSRDVEAEVEERAVSIIFNLFQNLGPRGGRRERVAAKFVESEFEKCDRLMEMFLRYSGRVAAREEKMIREAEENEEEVRRRVPALAAP